MAVILRKQDLPEERSDRMVLMAERGKRKGKHKRY